MLFWLESLVLGGSGPIIGIHPFTGLVFHPVGFLATLLISSQKKTLKKSENLFSNESDGGAGLVADNSTAGQKTTRTWKTRSIHHSISNQVEALKLPYPHKSYLHFAQAQFGLSHSRQAWGRSWHVLEKYTYLVLSSAYKIPPEFWRKENEIRAAAYKTKAKV